ncbi:MAG: DUF1826 domain-containing protein [Myxococcota bacterium]
MPVEPHRTTPLSRSALEAILDRDTNIVSLPRSVDPSMRAALVQTAQRSTFRHAACLDTSSPDVGDLLADIQDQAVADFLAADIGHLAQLFGATLGRRHLHAELAVQRTDGCRKIHADYVTVRMLCTYAGPGTEWLPDEHLVRKHLGASDLDLDDANRLVVRWGADVQRCEIGEVLLLKGHAYPGNAGRGAAHRSPPLGSSGVARLLLKIDEHSCGC